MDQVVDGPFPNNSNTGDFLFLRGNIGHHTEPDSFYEGDKIEMHREQPFRFQLSPLFIQ